MIYCNSVYNICKHKLFEKKGKNKNNLSQIYINNKINN